MQELMTKAIEETLPGLYETEGEDAPLARVHYFSCASSWDWYLVEYDPETGDAFGLVRGFEVEYGYFSVREMEAVNRRHGTGVIERDLYFVPRSVRELE